jgi:UDP-N-acetylmuramoyl-tripeptide--D-alanyl-D-alanine ligase
MPDVAKIVPLWTAHEIAAATQGQVIGDFEATGVSIDSRSIEPGDLFVALTGRARRP